ncbi:MAG: aminoacetone oxidase family FAD-binding enzyme [Lachnospiraceae bacterium]|nr:aminoacetone oxidase family FAD-binding enzyme [Lachnospiraceae bacterium]
MSRREKTAVIGGGMSGMAAAILLAECGRQAEIFERQERIGKKILLTGNGRCNLSNTEIDTAFYRCDDEGQLSRILSFCDGDKEQAFWERLGLKLRAQRGCLYPVTNQASTVLDCLRFRLEELRIPVHTEAECIKISGQKGAFTVQYRSAENAAAKAGAFDNVFLCCGGRAGVYREEEHNGYTLAKALGHTVKKGHPALVPVRCAEDMKAVAGVRVQADVSLWQAGTYLASDEGELQLTKEGISGIPVFQLSRYADDLNHSVFRVDFLPFLKQESLARILRERMDRMPGRSLEQFFAGWLQKKLCLYLLKRAGLKAEQTIGDMPLDRLKGIVAGMKACPFTPMSLGNYRQAQVSTGGIPLPEVSDHLESRKCPGIHIAGEMLDVTGACGGYNLHFALACAHAMTE